MDFIFSLNTELHNPFREAPIKNAVSMLERDMHKCLTNAVGPRNAITLVKDGQMAEESYQVAVADESRMTVTAGDDLGFVYGLLSISEALSGHKALLVLAGPTDSGAGLRGDPRRHLRRSRPRGALSRMVPQRRGASDPLEEWETGGLSLAHGL